MFKKEVVLFDALAAESEIYHVERTAQGLQNLIKILRANVVDYDPSIKDLEKIFRSRNVSALITEQIFKHRLNTREKKFIIDPDETEDTNLDNEKIKLRKEISTAIREVRSGNWEYWYSIENGSLKIRKEYKDEIREKHNHQLSGRALTAYIQAETLTKVLNESRELLGKMNPQIPGICLKDETFHLNKDYFIRAYC